MVLQHLQLLLAQVQQHQQQRQHLPQARLQPELVLERHLAVLQVLAVLAVLQVLVVLAVLAVPQVLAEAAEEDITAEDTKKPYRPKKYRNFFSGILVIKGRFWFCPSFLQLSYASSLGYLSLSHYDGIHAVHEK